MSDSPLAMPRHAHAALRQVQCRRGSASEFDRVLRTAVHQPPADSWYRYAALQDGSIYVGWSTIGEFVVSADGGHIVCRPTPECSGDSFQVYMLGQALSFALVKQRLEPLHATVVVVNDQAVAFLGGSAFGKSTLAACFLQAGHRLLTDDLLILDESAGPLTAYPGPARLKLFPEIARRFLGRADGARMNADTGKLIVAVGDPRSCARPVPLKAVYVLSDPHESGRQRATRIEPLSPREAFLELVRGTFNRRLAGPDRLACQFGVMSRLTDLLTVKRLTYPRAIGYLGDVRDAILADLARRPGPTRPAAAAVSPILH